MNTSTRIFEDYVKQALTLLPDEFRERMDNIVISVEPYPTREDLRSVGVSNKRHLLGIFRGIPFNTVSPFYSGPVMPSEIVLFQKNIEAVAETREDLIDQIRITLLHEIGHYFGMSEEDLKHFH
ncbi:MAG: metallopeptidase family protein [Deltaproteobacteria bacterium]|nr:metallopeptidase family protein [Candidatus Zymogenaceae bacterium]